MATRRDPRSTLFENYDPPSAPRARNIHTSYSPSPLPAASPYPSSLPPPVTSNYRPATPNSRGQYSDSTLNELESQNDAEVEGIMGKVRQLKSMTQAIGAEIRSSTNLAETLNQEFENSRGKLGGTMKRMLRMAERSGVPWRWWLVFFTCVGVLFWWVWLF